VYDEAMRAYERGAFDASARSFETCLATTKDPSTLRLARFYLGESLTRLADAALENGDGKEALRALREALHLHPNYPDLHLKAARAHALAGDPKSELAEAEAALERNPRYADGLLYLAALKLARGEVEEGTALAKRAEKVGASLAQAVLIAGEAVSRGDLEGAQVALKAAMGTAGDANDRVRLGDQAAGERRFADAAREYEAALQIAPRYADVRCKYGQALLELDRVSEAEHAFRQALEVNDKYVESWAQLGIALRRLDRDAEAREAFRQALSLDPAHAIAGLEVGRI
jgi:tetratricopeptide (TPR) repeat protein